MKVTTGAMERKNFRQPPKREWFYVWWPQSVALSLSSLTDLPLVLCYASVLVANGIMIRFLQPNQVAQVIQLHQEGTVRRKRVSCISQHSLKSTEETLEGHYTRRAGQGRRTASTLQQNQYLLCARSTRRSTARAAGVVVSHQTVRNGLQVVGMRPDIF